jgi:membrane dipeptidase
MFVDLSHVSADVMRQALQASRAPVIFSHSSARAIIDVPRNAPDDVLKMLVKNRGVIMVNFCPCFMASGIDTWTAELDSVTRAAKGGSPTLAQADTTIQGWIASHPMPEATVGDVADHIDHIKRIAGIDVIGLGSDFDGISNGPVGLEDVSKFPVLFAELIKRGYSDDELEKIAGLNLLRAMREMEATAARLQKSERPSLADIPATATPPSAP